MDHCSFWFDSYTSSYHRVINQHKCIPYAMFILGNVSYPWWCLVINLYSSMEPSVNHGSQWAQSMEGLYGLASSHSRFLMWPVSGVRLTPSATQIHYTGLKGFLRPRKLKTESRIRQNFKKIGTIYKLYYQYCKNNSNGHIFEPGKKNIKASFHLFQLLYVRNLLYIFSRTTSNVYSLFLCMFLCIL